MSSRRTICAVTGSRAEYGLLKWILSDLRDDKDVDLQIIATGTHLSPDLGYTIDEIWADGFRVDRRVDMLVSGDSGLTVAKSVGLGVIGMADAFEGLKPDLVLLLGDRFEILAAAQAALFMRLPVAHIAGGDTTEGAFDEAIRHSITKMSHVHLVTNEEARRRVRQLGEDPGSVHCVGSPGLDNLVRSPLMSRDELEESLGISLSKQNFLVTFHPVTLADCGGLVELDALLGALTRRPETDRFFITRPNADSEGRAVAKRLDEWAAGRRNVSVFTSLGHQRYLSLMSFCDAVIGNSSSGLYEAPSLGVPTVNVGNRQSGRLAGPSVLHSPPDEKSILAAIDAALQLDCSSRDNPYGDGTSSPRIVSILKNVRLDSNLLRKRFHFYGE